MATLVAAVWLALAVGALPAAAGQQEKPPQDPDNQIDVWDWLRSKRKKNPDATPETPAADQRKTSLLVVPLISSKPSTGFAFGGGLNVEFPLGPPGDTYVSSVLAGATYSVRKDYSVIARPTVFGSENRWSLAGDHHYQTKAQDGYRLGMVAGGDPVTVHFTSLKLVDTYYRRLAPRFYVGAGFQVLRQSNVGPEEGGEEAWEDSPYVEYTEHYGFPLSGQTSAGLSVSLRRDSRDNVADPNKGWLAEASYRVNMADFLGGTSTWQGLYLDGRAYRRLTSDGVHKLAFWAYGDFVTGGIAPYLALPATGTDTQGRSGRGYAEGRFRGDRLVYGELEYRVMLRRDGLVGMVAFLNATTAGSSFEETRVFDDVAFAGGFGFRLRLAKRSRTNLCLDFGWGEDGSRGLYIALAEVF